jgi:hypothetical protein
MTCDLKSKGTDEERKFRVTRSRKVSMRKGDVMWLEVERYG